MVLPFDSRPRQLQLLPRKTMKMALAWIDKHRWLFSVVIFPFKEGCYASPAGLNLNYLGNSFISPDGKVLTLMSPDNIVRVFRRIETKKRHINHAGIKA